MAITKDTKQKALQSAQHTNPTIGNHTNIMNLTATAPYPALCVPGEQKYQDTLRCSMERSLI